MVTVSGNRISQPLSFIALAALLCCGQTAQAQFCDNGYCDSGCESGCDAGCDSMSSHKRLFDSLVPRRGCGKVGSLFRWSDAPCVSELPQIDEPLVTDRPDFTEASSVVGLGVLQLETGYTYTYNNDAQRTIGHSYPETLFRYGVLADWLEFRLAWNYLEEDVNGVDTSGSDDLYLGFKIGLTPQDGLRPEMALIPQMTVPSGGSQVTANEVLAGANWLYSWGLNDCVSTGGSTQFNKALDGTTGDSYTEWAQSWTIAYSLTGRVGAYTEYFGFYPSGADTARTEHYFNGGFTFLIHNDMQFDVRGGTGLNGAADDYFVGTGLSIRLR